MNQEEKWCELKNRLKIGDKVEGKVVHKTPFGDFIDIEAGFSTLLEIIEIPELTPDQYRTRTHHPVGSKIKAYIAQFFDWPQKEIRLTQKPLPEWIKSE